jgi:hypothetical protein
MGLVISGSRTRVRVTEIMGDSSPLSRIAPVEAREACVAESGWFKDPYGRHDARWISGGSPTSLVRDGTIESTDHRPEALSGGDAGPLEALDHGTTSIGKSESKRSVRGIWFIVVGVAAIVGGVYLAQAPAVPTRTFVPSPGELAVLQRGGTADPPGCPSSDVGVAPDSGLTVTPAEADTQFTVYPRSSILVYVGQDYSAELSASAPACDLDDSQGLNVAETTYYLNRPGKVTVSFIDRDDHVSVVSIVVTSASPPSATPGWALILLGVLACGFGIVLWYRRIGGHVPDDLKRADEASRSGSYDPEKAQRAAWDALDQSSGQY